MKQRLIDFFQILIFCFFYIFFFLFVRNKFNKISWVIGVQETSNNIVLIKKLLTPSVNVSFTTKKIYKSNFDYKIEVENIYFQYLLRIIYGPFLFAYLINKHTHFFYVSSLGFFINREIDFKILNLKQKKIICLFTGDDIRSLKLTLEYALINNLDSFANYSQYKFNIKYDNERKKMAKIADKYADIIFSVPIDQISYLKSKQFFWKYIYDKSNFNRNEQKFIRNNTIKIVHAPSSPTLKGTPLVRAAIKKLELEEYKFEYIELTNVPNSVVLEHLYSSHIVLNQFYAYMPGLFGVEAMANHCAVLMSADPNIETLLPKDSQNAWLITKYWEVYDNLKYLLDNPEKIKYYADNGYDFAYSHYTYENVKKYINEILEENNVI